MVNASGHKSWVIAHEFSDDRRHHVATFDAERPLDRANGEDGHAKSFGRTGSGKWIISVQVFHSMDWSWSDSGTQSVMSLTMTIVMFVVNCISLKMPCG